MGRAYTRYSDGFTLSLLHNSDKCSRCKKINLFYTKMRNKEPPWDNEDARKVDLNCPPYQRKYYGLISFLNSKSRGRKKKEKPACKGIAAPQSSYFTRRRAERQAADTVLRNNVPSYQSYKKIEKTDIQKNIIDQKHVDRLKSRLTKESRADSPAAENNTAEENVQSSVSSSGELDERDLKRKLRRLKKLQRKTNYEDDIFEEKCFYVFKTSNDEEESDSSDIQNMETPKCDISLSPRARSESPVYEDCYCPKELGAIRRDAEEFRYRRRKRRKLDFCTKKEELSDTNDSVNSEDADHKTLLENVSKAVPLKPEKDPDTDDSYFTDSSEDQSEIKNSL